ncbi:MAG: CerR family C-terminal domain-containing protein [Acidobacteria bacterium]|nr:CerR family C-terminal domain-containing protein [Acidobacteriota bacterium]
MTEGPAHQSAESDTTRERLLESAERLFAERGYDATSVREITQAAHCNVASVNYHFGGKDNLYLQVFQRRLDALRRIRTGRLEQALEEAGDDADVELVLSTFTASFMEPLIDESEGRLIMELMAREMLDPHLPRHVLFETMIDPVRRSLASALRQVAPGLDQVSAELCVHSIVGQLVHVIHHARLRHGPDAPSWPAEELERMARHITRFSTAGVLAVAGGDGR